MMRYNLVKAEIEGKRHTDGVRGDMYHVDNS